MLALAASVTRGPAAELLRRPDRSTLERLDDAGFGPLIIERFFRPLFAGIQLDPALEVSSRRFEIILRMLAVGAATVPALGMGAIPEQLAAGLPRGVLRLDAPVERVEGTSASLADGTRVRGRAMVVATSGPVAAELLGLDDPGITTGGCDLVHRGSPAPGRARRCCSTEIGPVPPANVAVMSEVAPTYAPPGRSLVVAAIPGPAALAGGIADDTTRQMRTWFGPQVEDWDVIRVDVIPHGQPDQRPPLDPRRRIALGGRRYVCGDHRDTASIQGAMFSGRRTGRAGPRRPGHRIGLRGVALPHRRDGITVTHRPRGWK